MNREIKFRVWNGKKINYKPVICDETDGGTTSCIDLNVAISCCDEILMQFTGLKDKNGKEIYESDIVEISCPAFRLNCEVKFSEQLACFVVESLDEADKGVRKPFKTIVEDRLIVKIIGNIYEHPYLLESKNKNRYMKTTSYEISKKLKEIGFKAGHEKYWVKFEDQEDPELRSRLTMGEQLSIERFAPSYDLETILEALLKKITDESLADCAASLLIKLVEANIINFKN